MDRSFWRNLCQWFGPRSTVEPSGEVFLAAAELGDALGVKEQLRAGVRPDEPRCPNSQTALCLAAHYGHREVAKVLLAAGADPLVQGTGATPLFRAAFRGHHEVIAAMAAARPDVFRTKEAALALRRAALSGHSLAVRALLQGGTPANASARDYPSALFAAATCDAACLTELLLFGADPYELDQQGRTALHIAASVNDVGCVMLLLKYKVNPLALDNFGRSSIDVASSDYVRDLLRCNAPNVLDQPEPAVEIGDD